MAYTAKDFSHLIGMPGFSDALLNNHFTLYQGYVANTNKLLDTLARLQREGKTDSPEFAELKRHFGWEFDGMRVHELYFGNLGGRGDLNEAGELRQALEAQFGSYHAWENDFRTTGMVRGIGWVILYQDTATGRLLNFWINEHDTGHPAGCAPILVMDVWEHAYMLDYGTKRAGYIDAFFRNIDWAAARNRLNVELAIQAAKA
ncbi:MAG: superoxide dismutase [Anaerolineae bacterium]|nr:superoxide dismutase [Anaerolineae bacterium]